MLKPGARLLFRVNATDDLHYGASDGVEVERHLRATDDAYTGDDLDDETVGECPPDVLPVEEALETPFGT